MIQIDDTIISQDVINEEFVCNIAACKGICCVEGDAGAPIDPEETLIMQEIYPHVAPYLSKEGRKSIEPHGTTITAEDGSLETPLIHGKECAYTIFDERGTALCAIEKAYNEGKISWKKPISCHLYPIRLTQYTSFTAVNYERWSICHDACTLGQQLKVPVYKFVKEALIRKFGSDWYAELEQAAELLQSERS